MSRELIGNGNLPCVYTSDIFVNESESKVSVSYDIYDFVDSRGQYTWTTKEFLTNEIYLFSIIIYDEAQLASIQEILQFENATMQKEKLENIVFSTATVLNPIKNSTVTYKTTIDHQCDLSGDLHILSVLAYDIEKQAGTNIIETKQKFFIGPTTLDTIKIASNPSSGYELRSQFFKNQDKKLYEGSFHLMPNGQPMTGVIHDESSVPLERESLSNQNPKLSILRDYFNIYPGQAIVPIEFSDITKAISKPLWSFNDNLVTCIFKVDRLNVTSNTSTIARHNYFKVLNSITAKIYKSTTEPEAFQESRPLTNIRVNHQSNSGEMFYEISAIIPDHLMSDTSGINLKVTANFTIDSGATLLDKFFSPFGSIEQNKSNFLNTDTEDNYKTFIKMFLIALSLRYEITNEQIVTEMHILFSSLGGKASPAYKEILVSLFDYMYSNLLQQYTTNIGTQYTTEKQSSSGQIDLNNLKNNKFPEYFKFTSPSGFSPNQYFSSTQFYMPIKDLQRRLEDESRRVFDKGVGEIFEGNQQIMPATYLNRNIYNIPLNVFNGDIAQNLNYYKTNENPGLVYQSYGTFYLTDSASDPEVSVGVGAEQTTQQIQFEQNEIEFQELQLNTQAYEQRVFYQY
jgi:hypothetical protein